MTSQQKRTVPRIKVNWRAQACMPEHAIVEARVINISVKGLALEIDSAINVGQTLLLKIYAVSQGKIHEILVRAEVRHTCLLAANRGIGAGCQFVEVGKAGKKILAKIFSEPTAKAI